MARLHITDLEAAINHWRARAASPDDIVLAPPLRALAEVYALLVFHHQDEADEHLLSPQAREAWDAWYDTTPARATTGARAAGAVLPRCSTGWP